MIPPRSVFIHSREIERFHYPPDSPFETRRAGRTREVLSSMGFLTGSGRREVPPARASREELLRFHAPEYVEALARVSKGRIEVADLTMGIGTADCPAFADLYEYASLAAGGTLTGARLILEGQADIAFNPSGGYHHARAREASGFCYVNDVVLACQLIAGAGKKVFCLDLDAHHGNGTQEAFYNNPRVFTVSLHESGKSLFPWGGFEDEIGTGDGRGFNANLPFPAGTDDETYYRAFREVVPPLISAFAPDVIVLEIGMDILKVDPLTHLGMTNNVIADIIPLVLQYDRPILAVGGGGYSPEDTARGWALAWCVLNRIEMEEDLYMGLGGVFLGSTEWHAGLRDPHAYLSGGQKSAVAREVAQSVARLRGNLAAFHSI